MILVPNAKIYEFQVENKNFKITREEMLSILHRIFDDFPKEKDIWDKNKVIKFFNGNEEKLKCLWKIKIFGNLYLLNIQ